MPRDVFAFATQAAPVATLGPGLTGVGAFWGWRGSVAGRRVHLSDARSQSDMVVLDASKRQTDSMRGIACMALGMFLFSAVDTQAKYLTETLHPFQIVWSRQLGLLGGVLILLWLRGRRILHTRNPGLQIGRGLMAASSATLFIFAVTHVPLADAVAVSFVAPFMVTALGALVLGERVGRRRWIAISVAFLAALIIIRPGLGVFHPAMWLVVLAAFLFAMRQIFSRLLSSADPTETTVAYTAITASVVLTIPMLFVWRTPQGATEIVLLISLALLAAAAETLVIRSLELAEAVVLAPVHFSLLIWGSFYGWLVFDQFPDGWTWVGSAIIVATGIYTVRRERRAQAVRRGG